jgi:hypothetical protein
MTVSRGAVCTAKFCYGPRADNMASSLWPRSLGLVLAALLALPAWSQEQKGDLADRSLEDLMNTQVTSVSKREQKLSDAAVAIFVITQEDIRPVGGHHHSGSVTDGAGSGSGTDQCQLVGH